MATFSESFDKADGALGPDLSWSIVEPDDWLVIGNQASPSGLDRGTTAYARAEHDTDTADQYAQCSIAALGTGDSQGGPCVRFDPSANNSYMAMVDTGASTILIRRTDGGSRTTLAESGPIDLTGLPKVLRVEAEGTAIRGYWDGVNVVSTTDGTYTTATRAGLYGHEDTGEGLGFVIDDFEFGDLAAPATDLTVADVTHSPTLDAVTVTQVHTLTVADASQTPVLDAVDVAQVHVLTVSDVTHAPTLDTIGTIDQATQLTIADVTHAPVLGVVTVTQTHQLATADVTHAPTLDTVNLGQAQQLTVADVTTAPVLDGVTVAQVHNLTVADVTHAPTLDVVTLPGVLGALIVGDVTGPATVTQAITGPALVRTVTGPATRRTVTGMQMSATRTVTGPELVSGSTPDGLALSRVVTGTQVSRTVTGPEE